MSLSQVSFLAFAAFLLGSGNAFQAPVPTPYVSRSLQRIIFAQSAEGPEDLAKPPSYAQILKKAREARKQGKNVNAALRAQRQQAPKKAQDPSAAAASNTPAAASYDNLPFSDEIYEAIVLVLKLLPKRVKGNTVLSDEEKQKLDDAITAIVADSQGIDKSEVPAAPQATPAPQAITPENSLVSQNEDEDGSEIDMDEEDIGNSEKKNIVYKTTKEMSPGTANTYYMEGLDAMTPTEYRAALDAKIQRMREERLKQGVRAGAHYQEEYFNAIRTPQVKKSTSKAQTK